MDNEVAFLIGILENEQALKSSKLKSSKTADIRLLINKNYKKI